MTYNDNVMPKKSVAAFRKHASEIEISLTLSFGNRQIHNMY